MSRDVAAASLVAEVAEQRTWSLQLGIVAVLGGGGAFTLGGGAAFDGAAGVAADALAGNLAGDVAASLPGRDLSTRKTAVRGRRTKCVVPHCPSAVVRLWRGGG